MSPAEFAEAQLPATPVILGWRVQPLTVGHAILLERLKSPFAGGKSSGFAAGLGDVLLTLEVCSHEPFYVPSRWRMRWLKFRHHGMSDRALATARMEIVEYIRAAYVTPAYWQEEKGDESDSGVPFLMTLKLGLIKRMGLSEAAAMQTPIRLALQQLYALCALAGKLELITEEDQAMKAMAAAARK